MSKKFATNCAARADKFCAPQNADCRRLRVLHIDDRPAVAAAERARAQFARNVTTIGRRALKNERVLACARARATGSRAIE